LRRDQARRDLIADVAVTYQAAVKAGEPTSKAIADQFRVTLDQARSLIRAGRRDGRIPSAEKHYLHAPALAVIHPRGARRKSWTVCETCLVEWPCRHARTNHVS